MTTPTPRQQEVLAMIRAHWLIHCQGPTYRDIMRAFGWTSTNAATSVVRLLARKGHLLPIARGKGSNRARAIIPSGMRISFIDKEESHEDA